MKGRVLRPDKVCGDLRVFQVDGILIHANGKGSDLFPQEPGGDRADQTGIQPAGEKKAERRVRVQAFFHPGDQPVPDAFADRLQIVAAIVCHRGQIRVTHKVLPVIVMSRWEGTHLFTESYQILRLTGEGDAAVLEIAVVQRSDADRIPRGD